MEFALASLPMVIMIFGFVAVSAVFNTMSSMQSNTQYAARMMSTGQITQNANGAISSGNATATASCGSAAAATSTDIEYYACTGLPSWATYTVTSTENCAVPSVTVSISVNARTAAIADVVGIFTGQTITMQTVLMKEGSCP